jgi:putative phage-type endonuclease
MKKRYKMKIIELEQGSQEWLSWRKTVITATDCPAIRGTSPWSTAYKAWQRKLGLIEEQKSNDAMERGKGLEPIIRERFIKNFGMNMAPAVVESSEYEFLGASLDGLSECGKYILEVKTGGHKLHEMAKNGVVPDYYMDQMQHQLLVTAADKCFYQVGGEDEQQDEIVIEVYPDLEFAKSYVPMARGFWTCVQDVISPQLSMKDYHLQENSDWLNAANEWTKINQQMKELEKQEKKSRSALITLSNNENSIGGGVRLSRIISKGRVDYSCVPELKSINLDAYRKPANESWRLERC